MIYGSPRQALAYLYAHHRGPSIARPRYHDAPPDTGRSHLDGPLVGALLYGPRSTGGCAIVPGSPEDLELRQWATSPGGERTSLVLAVERRMRASLRAHGLLLSRRRPPPVRHWVDPEGATWGRLSGNTGTRANSRCADVQNMAENP